MTANTPTAEEPGIQQLRKPALTRFLLYREEDETGISGEGIVAEGVEFETGQCALSWLTSFHSIAIYPSAAELTAIHGHDGRTRIVWCSDDHVLDSVHSLG